MSTGAYDHYYESSDGLRLYCKIYPASGANGDSVPVLCLPGLTRNGRDFVEVAQHLSTQREVLTPDLRGRGRSAWDPEASHYQVMTYVQDIWSLLGSLVLQRVLVIGTSLGALMGMLMAATQPARIAGLILNDAGPELNPEGIRRIQSYAGKLPPVHSWAEAAAQTKSVYSIALPDLSDTQWLDYARRGYRENESGVPMPDVDPQIAQALRSAAASGASDLWPVFRQIRATPVLVIRGALSDLLSAAIVERMALEHPGLERLTVPNRGHAPLLTEPECVAAIDGFVARNGRL